MTGTDLLLSLLAQCTTLALVVWALTQSLGKGVPWLLKVPQGMIALVLGPLCGMAAHWWDWIGVGASTGVKGYAAAAFLGLAATFTSGELHDRALGPLIDAMLKKAPSP